MCHMPEDSGLRAKSEGFRVETVDCNGGFAVYRWGFGRGVSTGPDVALGWIFVR